MCLSARVYYVCMCVRVREFVCTPVPFSPGVATSCAQCFDVFTDGFNSNVIFGTVNFLYMVGSLIVKRWRFPFLHEVLRWNHSFLKWSFTPSVNVMIDGQVP